MGKDLFFNIEWEGLEELDEEFAKMESRFREILVEEYTQYGLLVEEGAKSLVHHDQGDLEDSIHFNKAEVTGDEVIVQGGSNLKYALKRHEAPYRMGVHDKYDNGAKFPNYYVGGRGRGTHAKPSWRGYKPGRKYLENAIKATEKDFDKMNTRILKRTYGDKK
ncbi:HK97 gp10 family phage protein [Bacillus suaedae]|uniref:HK97 gp10 family phage protein n=1 Tax=Halalkalibacter suaedae TaxID=2822140 RepID=A0A941APP4_9BACI|nr:HK97 gp10 family phage protein [Bacillus suaedae]MBP3950338.1 HK97 gp10 family phage protein [Bacillus suaedae]